MANLGVGPSTATASPERVGEAAWSFVASLEEIEAEAPHLNGPLTDSDEVVRDAAVSHLDLLSDLHILDLSSVDWADLDDEAKDAVRAATGYLSAHTPWADDQLDFFLSLTEDLQGEDVKAIAAGYANWLGYDSEPEPSMAFDRFNLLLSMAGVLVAALDAYLEDDAQ